jgi:hypothetical protein
MAAWRRQAISLIPQMRTAIEKVDNVRSLWIDLHNAFFENIDGGDQKLCTAIRNYYRWCVSPDRERLPNDIQTAAVLEFIEKFARTPELIAKMPKWVTSMEALAYSWNIVYAGGEAALENVKKAYSCR